MGNESPEQRSGQSCSATHSRRPLLPLAARHRQGILIARDGRHGVYARCISRVCGTVAAKQVPQSSVHLQPTHQDSLTRRCHRKTLSLTCLVVSGPLQGRCGAGEERRKGLNNCTILVIIFVQLTYATAIMQNIQQHSSFACVLCRRGALCGLAL